MPSREEYMGQPLERRLARLARTPDELDKALRTRSAELLSRRPDASNWSATEIDAGHALAGFRRHREETLALLNSLSDAQWLRGGIHSQRGRLTLADWVASLASHDDNHVDQLRRALDGRP
jgi:hypothetical protein